MSLPQVRRRVDASVGRRAARTRAVAEPISIPLLRLPPVSPVEGDRSGVAAEPTPQVPPSSTRAPERTARIDVWRGHRATLEPVVPEVREYLTRTVIAFDAGGPLGHRMRPTR